MIVDKEAIRRDVVRRMFRTLVCFVAPMVFGFALGWLARGAP